MSIIKSIEEKYQIKIEDNLKNKFYNTTEIIGFLNFVIAFILWAISINGLMIFDYNSFSFLFFISCKGIFRERIWRKFGVIKF